MYAQPEKPDSRASAWRRTSASRLVYSRTLWEADDAIPEFSFTALTDGGIVGHLLVAQTVARRQHLGARRPQNV